MKTLLFIHPLLKTNKMKKQKNLTWWIIGILIVIAVGVYFWLSGDSGSIVNTGGNIPSPPALPS